MTSAINWNGESLFDDSNFQVLVDEATKMGTGYMPRSEHPRFPLCGDAPFLGTKLPPKFPRGEWEARVKELEEKQERLSDLIWWPQKNQASTNFCWGNGPCGSAETQRVAMNLPYVEYSSASVCCKLNNFQNRGGWGIDAIQYMAKTGACEAKLWPNAAISRQYDTAEADFDRPNHITVDWADVGRDFDMLYTLLLLRVPCPVGYDWWGHEVYACDPVIIEKGRPGIRIRNSWLNANWGDKNKHGVNGFGVLDESKGTPDDCQAVWSQTASEG